MFARIFLFLHFCFIVTSSLSQNYPVTASLLLHPPFTGYLSDYKSSDAKMSLIVTLNDYSLSAYPVKLKFSLRSQGIEIKSKDYFFSGPYILTPGLPLLIEGDDFNDLLNPQHLSFQGVNNSSDLLLPEGEYDFLIEVYDYNSLAPVKVSNDAWAKEWLIQYEPPLLNLPVDNAQVEFNAIPFIIFTWAPQHLGVAPATTNVRYRFELWHRFSPTLDVNALVSGVAPLFTFDLDEPLFYYTNQFTPLINGYEYVWRVKASILNGPDRFKNNGYSPIYTFKYGSSFSNLLVDLNLTARAINPTKAKLVWDSFNLALYFQLQFRKKDSTFLWQSKELTDAKLLLEGLEPSKNYEARVRLALPDNSFSQWCNPVQFSMPDLPVYSCEDVPLLNSMEPFKPLTAAYIGMEFQIGLFNLKITQLKNMESPLGIYSGKGTLQFPFSVSLLCEFENVKLNEDHKMVSGIVSACTEGIQNWMDSWLEGNLGNETHSYSGTVDSVAILPNGNCIVYGSNGVDTLRPSNYPFVLMDSNGNAFTIISNGEMVPIQSPGSLSLSDEVKRVYRLSLLKLRELYTLQKIDSLSSRKEQISTEFINSVGQKNNIQFSESSDFDQIIIFSPVEEKTQIVATTNFKTAELNYIVAKVIYYFSNRTMRQWDYILLADGLEIEGQKSPDYITANFKAGIPESQTVNACASSILAFIERVVSKKIYGE